MAAAAGRACATRRSTGKPADRASSALDYMERVLGYSPRAAQDRLRVARALGELPVLTAALARGELPFSAVRELTRVATPSTEAAWADRAAGKNLRQIEELVAGRRPGDRPDDPPDPDVRTHVVRYVVSAETYAVLRQARAVLDAEHVTNLDDDEFIATLARGALDASSPGEPSGRARYQIAVTVCERCRQGWQEGGGATIAIGPEAVARAECDAQHVGSVDAAEPERAHQDIPPAINRLVWRRDKGKCRVPGCRSARGLEIHHIVHRADGGTHAASNCILLCSACHRHHHAGRLAITGTANQLEVRRIAEPPPPARAEGAASDARVGGAPSAHVGAASRLDAAITCAQAKDALVSMGWKPSLARPAVDAASAALGAGATLEQVIIEALRRCPRPIL